MTSNFKDVYEVSPIITKSISAKLKLSSANDKSAVTEMKSSQIEAQQPILSADDLTSPIISRQQQEGQYVF